MFTQELPAGVFTTQREFMRVMDSNRDFVWWAKTLITEETKELLEEFNKEDLDLANILKELADVIYVVAGFYNCLPMAPHEIVSEETNVEIQRIITEAAASVSKVSQDLKIPLPIIVASFEEVHRSNMSKVGDDGKPIRREDGKILKGPNYTPPDLTKHVHELNKFHALNRAKERTTHATDAAIIN